MLGASTLEDIKHDLDGMPRELADDLHQLAADAAPALKDVVGDAGARGSAIGTTVATHLRDRAAEHLPDPDAIRSSLPRRSAPRRTRLLAVLGVAVAAGAGIAAWRWRAARRTPARPARPAPQAAPTDAASLDEDPLDIPEGR